ncbi:hypothetical protein GCM10011513_12130 [Franconibacter daqui]|nr:hypothetical protein GCM10011513_12130 [Franconibacter daqui]
MTQFDIHIFKISFEIINILDRRLRAFYPEKKAIPVACNSGDDDSGHNFEPYHYSQRTDPRAR